MKGRIAYRIVLDDGTVLATVYDADEATLAREYYADRYQTIVQIVRVKVADNRW